jgi:(2Fe-2S) ferredoxin
MKPIEGKDCLVHAMVCTNERPAGKSSCKVVGGQEFYERLKEKVKLTGLYDTHWITRSGCLGFCSPIGCTVAIYRSGLEPKWLGDVLPEDFERVWEEIIGGASTLTGKRGNQ